MIIDGGIPFLNDIYQYILDHLVIFIIVFSLIGIFIYSMIAVFLNKLNYEMYGKTTWMAWIPVFRIFLLGKLTIHWTIGIILSLGLFCCISVTINTKTYSILPEDIREIFMIVYIALCIALYVFAHIKLSNIRIRGKGYSNQTYADRSVMSDYDKKYLGPNKENIDNNKDNKPVDDFYGSNYSNTETSNPKPPVTFQDLFKKPKDDETKKP